MGRLLILRHGETEWSRDRRHTGLTDKALTSTGETEARRAEGMDTARVLTSPLQRARRTAELVGMTEPGSAFEVDADLVEWDYGDYEGRTSADIHQEQPGWEVWSDGAPGGESPADVGRRIDRVLDRVRPLVLDPDDGSGAERRGSESPDPVVVVVGHGHALRVLTARWLGLEPEAGRLFRLDTAAMGVLGFEHSSPTLRGWNLLAAKS